MPSLKMKSKSTTGCLKEKNGLHVCPKSIMISKDPLSRARVTQNAEEVGTYDLSCEDGSVYDEVYREDLGGNGAEHDKLSKEEKHLQKLPSSVTDSATADIMDVILSTRTSNIETMFSSIVEPTEFHNSEGNDDLYVPQLDSEESDDSSKSSYETCAVSDSVISDMIFSGSPIDCNSFFNNKTDSLLLPDYICEESSLFCNLTEEYMLLPFLEDTSDTGHDHGCILSEDTIIDADNSSLYMAIHQLRPGNQESHVYTYTDPDYECFDPQIYIRNLPDQLDSSYSLLAPSLPNEKQTTKRNTLVLDLDETLVHSSLVQRDDADFTFTVFFNSKEHIVYVKQRPHLHTFLERVAKMFEIVVFTASQSIYAEQLLDILDPDGRLISRRAYRESCILSDGNYIKDLTVLGVDLAKVAIVDNSPQVFRLQVNNGIPIESWFDDPSDCALISLLPFLETLVDADDVRPIIARKFGNWD